MESDAALERTTRIVVLNAQSPKHAPSAIIHPDWNCEVVLAQPRTISRRVKMASTAGGVLRRAQCPVLTIPARPSSGGVASASTGILAATHEPVSSPACEPTVGTAGVPFH